MDKAESGDEILVATGVYTDVHPRDGSIQVVFISKTVTIRGGYTTTNWTTRYPITQPTTLDAQGQGRVLHITGDISPTVEGLRITGGDATELGGRRNFCFEGHRLFGLLANEPRPDILYSSRVEKPGNE